MTSLDKSFGALSLNVNGLNHKGTVQIVLVFNDTYIVEFMDNHLEVIKSVGGVYCDQ